MNLEARVRQLPCWRGEVKVEPLHGGLSNVSYIATDIAGRHVVRFGEDLPFHHVSRQRELMVAHSAAQAGFGPQLEYSEPGVMVSRFIEAVTMSADSVRANPLRIGELLRRFHIEMPANISGEAYLFWVFHVIRDYARILTAGKSRWAKDLDAYVSLANELEQAQIALPIIFGHGDLLPANFLDDGERLWLIDFEYAGFSTAMFDLAGAAANAEMNEAQARELLTAYFGKEPDPPLWRAFSAMQAAALLREAMWGMISELHMRVPGIDYGAYAQENLARLGPSLERFRTTRQD